MKPGSTHDPEKKKRTIQTVQNTEVIMQGVSACLLKHGWNFACRLPGEANNHHGKVLFALLDKLKK
jgi:hypothetical protein